MQKSTFSQKNLTSNHSEQINEQALLLLEEDLKLVMNELDEWISEQTVSDKSVDYILKFAKAYEAIPAKTGMIDFIKN